MSDGLNTPQDGFATIPDVSVGAVVSRVEPRQVASGMTRGIQQLGSDKVYSDGGNQQIIVEDTNEPRVMMGNHTTFGEGFYVSKDGTNVKTNTNAANLIFNSNQNTFKIALTSTVILTPPSPWASGNIQTVTIPHGLSIVPAFQVFCQVPAIGLGYAQENKLLNLPILFTATPATYPASFIFVEIVAYSDATNLYISMTNDSATSSSGWNKPFVFRYYIQQETAS